MEKIKIHDAYKEYYSSTVTEDVKWIKVYIVYNVNIIN
jgi:hypothetical protein